MNNTDLAKTFYKRLHGLGVPSSVLEDYKKEFNAPFPENF